MSSNEQQQFPVLSRLLHWVMAVMILSMLGIGTAIVTSLKYYHTLITIHRPLGIAILVLALIRLINRMFNPPPPLPASIPRLERLAAILAEYTMYVLIISLPLVGWGMLSAAHYPVVMWGSFHLPEIMPHSASLYAFLRKSHTLLAAILFVVILAHLSAILFHSLVIGDGFWRRMAPWPVRGRNSVALKPHQLHVNAAQLGLPGDAPLASEISSQNGT